MADISVHFKAACSYKWHSDSKSMPLCKAFKAFGAGIKGWRGKYKVAITDQTVRLATDYPNSYFAREARSECLRYIQQLANPQTNIIPRDGSEHPPTYSVVALTAHSEYNLDGFVRPNEQGEFPPLYTPAEVPTYKQERDTSSPPSYEDIFSNAS
ncbi:hypothetical protein [Endozoicomonas atrinae]|uniref:hypothetical protein n=1 Tax=Endozoicomonas atrinae TaxID=1333660 RepID=UPI000824AEEB|nr:hypothetical protein [Endozoicomonas atrinae]